VVPREATPLYEVFRGMDLDGTVFRVVRGCPPTVNDFSSYEARGTRYDRRDFFKGSGVSMYRTRDRAVAVGRRFSHGDAIATVDLNRTGIVWSPTGRQGHITVWAAPTTLLEQVVQCESYEH
jgi:hypothetical protein